MRFYRIYARTPCSFPYFHLALDLQPSFSPPAKQQATFSRGMGYDRRRRLCCPCPEQRGERKVLPRPQGVLVNVYNTERCV